MKKIILFSALFMAGIISAHAQTKSDEAAIKTMWKAVYEAYNAGKYEEGFAYYTENAVEIGPDGQLLSGKNAIRENWTAFMKMVDERPKFNYSNPVVNVITPDVAVLTWDSHDEIKIQGQQVSGKMKGIAVVHKINGKWLVEADALTPVMQMTDPSQSAKN